MPLEVDAARRSKTLLSLRWLEAATRASGLDGFLKYWIALETLWMTDYGNLNPLVESLAPAYGLTPQEARKRSRPGACSACADGF